MTGSGTFFVLCIDAQSSFPMNEAHSINSSVNSFCQFLLSQLFAYLDASETVGRGPVPWGIPRSGPQINLGIWMFTEMHRIYKWLVFKCDIYLTVSVKFSNLAWKTGKLMIHPVPISSSYGKLLLDNSDFRKQNVVKRSSHFIGLKILVLVPETHATHLRLEHRQNSIWGYPVCTEKFHRKMITPNTLKNESGRTQLIMMVESIH